MQSNKLSRRKFIKMIGIAATIMPISQFSSSCDNNNKMNFVFILVDDLGWRDLGCYGSTFYETPNLDRLSSKGMRFTDAYASCPVCSPTRASILTGKHPVRLNITDWIPGYDPKNRRFLGTEDEHQLPLKEITIAETLKKYGYKTFFAGKWHLGNEGFFPKDQGFEINIGGHHKGSPPGGYYTPYNNPKLSDGPKGEYLSDRLTNESIKFLETNGENPFLLFLSFYTVHTPIQACKRFQDKFKTKAGKLSKTNVPKDLPEHDGFSKQRQDNYDYASMIYAMDENVGRLLNKLDDLKLTDNTTIIFTSDNGGLCTLPKRGYPTSNLPLRSGKGWCYEGGIRTPLIIKVPNITIPGSISKIPVVSHDFYPTILELADIKSLPDQHIDGISLVPLLKNNDKLKRTTLFWHYPHYHGSAWTPGAAIRSDDWKLIEFYDKEKVELYNLYEDIGEKNNLADIQPKKRDELLELLHKWQIALGAKLPQANPNYNPN